MADAPGYLAGYLNGLSGAEKTEVSNASQLILPATVRSSVSKPIKVAQFGSSSIAEGHFSDLTTRANSVRGIPFWVELITRRAVEFPIQFNYAVGGTRWADFIDGLDAKIEAIQAAGIGLVLVSNGANNDALYEVPIADTISRAETFIKKMTDAGIGVILVGPGTRGSTGFTAARFNAVARALNFSFRKWCMDQRGRPLVRVIDSCEAVIDPVSATADMVASKTNDGVHWTPYGAYSVAAKVAAEILDFARGGTPRVPVSVADRWSMTNLGGGLASNPFFSGSGGSLGSLTAGTGGLADGWGSRAQFQAGLTRTVSKVTSGGKDWQQLAWSNQTWPDYAFQYLETSINLADLSVGQAVFPVAEVEWDAPTNIRAIQLWLLFYSGVSQDVVMAQSFAGLSSLTFSIDALGSQSGLMRGETIDVPSGADGARLCIGVIPMPGVASSVSLRARAVDVLKV